MPWSLSSKIAGYLGPKEVPTPSYEDPWEDFIHDVIAGVTGLDPTMVRPGWQPRPPNQPNPNDNWVGFRITNTDRDWMPAIVHDGEGDGQDLLQRFEVSTVLCAFYGPQAATHAALLQDGLFIWQNQVALREANVGLVEFSAMLGVPEQYRNQWLNRVDTNMLLRREIRRNYPVLNLVRATGVVAGNTPGHRVVTTDFDTGEVP